jgi:hypothetical protein
VHAPRQFKMLTTESIIVNYLVQLNIELPITKSSFFQALQQNNQEYLKNLTGTNTSLFSVRTSDNDFFI